MLARARAFRFSGLLISFFNAGNIPRRADPQTWREQVSREISQSCYGGQSHCLFWKREFSPSQTHNPKRSAGFIPRQSPLFRGPKKKRLKHNLQNLRRANGGKHDITQAQIDRRERFIHRGLRVKCQVRRFFLPKFQNLAKIITPSSKQKRFSNA